MKGSENYSYHHPKRAQHPYKGLVVEQKKRTTQVVRENTVTKFEGSNQF